MSRNIIADRYGFALYEIAKEHNLVDQIEKEMHVLRKVVKENPEFMSLIRSYVLPLPKKKELISEVFSKSSPFVLNTLLILVDNGSFHHVDDVAKAFIQYANEEKGIGEATVYSVRPLTSEESELISKTFAKKIGKQSLNIENIVDTDLLAGVKIKIGNRIYDGSLRSQLDRLAKTIINT